MDNGLVYDIKTGGQLTYRKIDVKLSFIILSQFHSEAFESASKNFNAPIRECLIDV